MADSKLNQIGNIIDKAKHLDKRQILGWFKNFYFSATFFFVIWLLFIDSNNIFQQRYMLNRLNELKEQETYYKQQIEQIKKDMEELTSVPEEMEKFAREKYMFKRKGEVIYKIDESELAD
jgi:cell division protein FtsB